MVHSERLGKWEIVCVRNGLCHEGDWLLGCGGAIGSLEFMLAAITGLETSSGRSCPVPITASAVYVTACPTKLPSIFHKAIDVRLGGGGGTGAISPSKPCATSLAKLCTDWKTLERRTDAISRLRMRSTGA